MDPATQTNPNGISKHFCASHVIEKIAGHPYIQEVLVAVDQTPFYEGQTAAGGFLFLGGELLLESSLFEARVHLSVGGVSVFEEPAKTSMPYFLIPEIRQMELSMPFTLTAHTEAQALFIPRSVSHQSSIYEALVILSQHQISPF